VGLTVEPCAVVKNRAKTMFLSVVIPLLNERDNLPLLYERLKPVLDSLHRSYEILFVDDGSIDRSTEVLQSLAKSDQSVRSIHFTRNFGKSAALTAGFRNATGEIVITMDADLQDDPAEIPRFLEKLAGGYDIVTGWKFPRRDSVGKVVASRVFNGLVRLTTGLRLHDINCGFKAYSGSVARSLQVYGELHRFIPVLAHLQGYRVAELKVAHRPRQSGKSKYGLRRLYRGFFDLLTILFLASYRRRPLHFFGTLGLGGIMMGSAIGVYLTVLWLLGERPIGNRPLLILGAILIVVGIQVLTFGLLADMINATWHRGEDLYVVRTTYGTRRADEDSHD